MALKLGTQTNQILKDGDEVWIPSISSILLAVILGQKSKILVIVDAGGENIVFGFS